MLIQIFSRILLSSSRSNFVQNVIIFSIHGTVVRTSGAKLTDLIVLVVEMKLMLRDSHQPDRIRQPTSRRSPRVYTHLTTRRLTTSARLTTTPDSLAHTTNVR